MSDLAALGLMASCLSVEAPCYNKAGVRAVRWIIDNQDWKAPRVRHRWIP
jgi:hypothetical protein